MAQHDTVGFPLQRILITGCGGMLGESFYRLFSDYYHVRATDIDTNEPWLSFLDVRDSVALEREIRDFRPHFIFNLAALTDLEYCETHKKETLETNTGAVKHLAYLATDYGCTLIQISTAGIFDGKKTIYDDGDRPHPLSIYGKTKYWAEQVVHKYCRQSFIFRAGWMMGGGKKDKKFVNKILRQIQEGKKDLHVVTDLYGSPTYTVNMAYNALRMIRTRYYGTYNMVCSGGGNRFEVAREILRILNLSDCVRLHPVTSKYFAKEYFARRPRSEMLQNRRLAQKKLNLMKDWKSNLRIYLEDYWTETLPSTEVVGGRVNTLIQKP